MIDDFERELTSKCKKCGLEYKTLECICPHCAGKTNAQIIRDLHIPHSKQQEENASLGRQFIYIVIIIACLLLATI